MGHVDICNLTGVGRDGEFKYDYDWKTTNKEVPRVRKKCGMLFWGLKKVASPIFSTLESFMSSFLGMDLEDLQ